jgi:RNA methyltransferase, TrmH family
MITSSSNERVKQIRKLRERKERTQTGLFVVEGLRIAAEAVQLGAEVELLVVAPELLSSDFGRALVAKEQERGRQVLEVSRAVFEGLALKENPQGIAAVVRQRWQPLDAVQLAPGKDWIALDSVADPGNLGTVLRTGDAVGTAGVILLDHSTDPYDPSAIRASMGAVFSQRLVKTTFAEFADWKRRTGVFLVGTSDSAAEDYHLLRYPETLVLMMGSEREGLPEAHKQLCDAMARIPMMGRSDSLNLSVATAVMLYEVFNQRRGGSHDSQS